MKQCSTCLLKRPLKDFYKWNKSSDGRHYTCKYCHKERRDELKQKRQVTTNIPSNKQCISCEKTLPAEEFWKNSSSADGLALYCKRCGKRKNKSSVYKYLEENKIHIDWTGTKFCPTCKTEKTKIEFHKHLYHKDGLSSECKECTRIREYSDRALMQKMVNRARKRARDNNMECDIDLKYVQSIMTDTCPMLNIPLRFPSAKCNDNSLMKDNSPSIDRIDNSKGYVRENVIVVSHRANRIKNDATLDELKLIVSFLDKQLTVDHILYQSKKEGKV